MIFKWEADVVSNLEETFDLVKDFEGLRITYFAENPYRNQVVVEANNLQPIMGFIGMFYYDDLEGLKQGVDLIEEVESHYEGYNL